MKTVPTVNRVNRLSAGVAKAANGETLTDCAEGNPVPSAK